MKTASTGFLLIALISLVFATSCGSGSSSTVAPPVTSKIAKRVYVSNAFTGNTFIVDAATDSGSTFSVGTSGRPAIMQTIAAQKLTVVYEDLNNQMFLIDNSTEQVAATINIGSLVDDMAVQSDAKFIYVARGSLGRVDIIDVVNRTSNQNPPSVPAVRRLALAPNNTKLLAFSEPSDPASNTVKVLTLSNGAVSATNDLPGFDRAYTAIFNSDSSRAYVLSCGKECGGTGGVRDARVTILDMTTTPLPTVLGSVEVDGATVGLLNGTNLYVAGNTGNQLPTVSVVNVSNAATPTVTPSVTIQPGLHTMMALGANNKLFIGGRNCGGVSCLTIFDTASANVAPGASAFGNVTSIVPISGRNVVYVIEGGDLKIYDTTTNALQSRQINTTGALSVMNLIDP